MKMNKFEIKDIVKCIDNSNYEKILKSNGLYQVLKVYDTIQRVLIKDIGGEDIGEISSVAFSSDRFVEAIPKDFENQDEENIKHTIFQLIDATISQMECEYLPEIVGILDKQIPKKVLNIHPANHSIALGTCPNCMQRIDQYCYPHFCPHKDCGQALKWRG